MIEGIELLVANGASTFALTGLIWTVQLVHYPTFRYVSASQFVAFETFHQRRMSYVVVPLMSIELGTAMALLFFLPPSLPFGWAASGATLTLFIWASTFRSRYRYTDSFHGGLTIRRSSVSFSPTSSEPWHGLFEPHSCSGDFGSLL